MPSEDNKNLLADIVEIMRLVSVLAPPAVALVKMLAEDLQGRSDDEVLTEAHSAFERVKARALAEKARAANQ